MTNFERRENRRRDSGGQEFDRNSGNYRGKSYNRSGGHYKEIQSRIRYEDGNDVETRLQSLIARVGDTPGSSLERNIEGLAQVLIADISKHTELIMHSLLFCSIELPHKTPIYSTLIGLINCQNYDFGEMIVQKAYQMFQSHLDQGHLQEAQHFLRFLCDLANVNVVHISSMLSVFESLLSGLSDQVSNARRADFLIYLLLFGIPWIGKEMTTSKPHQISRVFQSIDKYIKSRPKVCEKGLSVWRSNPKFTSQEPCIEALWKQIKQLQALEWKDSILVRPYEYFEDALSSGMPHSIPSLRLPEPNDASVKYFYGIPQVRFHFFENDDLVGDELLPGPYSIERFFVGEFVATILFYFETNRRECTRQLANLKLLGQFNWDFIICESILAEIFRLPAPRYKQLYYYSVLMEICRVPESKMIACLEVGINILFSRLEYMDGECFFRFVDWFCVHLSNFGYTWPWINWKSIVDSDQNPWASIFVKQSLVRCIRYSYYDRIKTSLPETCQSWLPPPSKGNFLYGEDSMDEVASKIVNELASVIRSKQGDDAVFEILGNINLADTHQLPLPNMEDDDVLKLESIKAYYFCTAILFVGSKSYSHLVNVVERCLKILHSLSNSASSKQSIVLAIFEYWKFNSHMVVILLDKLLTFRILDSITIINYLFSSSLDDYDQVHFWEIYQNCLKKLTLRVIQLRTCISDINAKNSSTDSEKSELTESEENLRGLQLSEALETALREQKETFLVVFQRFIMVLGEHLLKLDNQGIDCQTDMRFVFLSGLLLETGRRYFREVSTFVSTLESLLFTSDVDPRIVAVFQDFRALC